MIVTWYSANINDKFTGNCHTDVAKELAKNNEVAIYFPFDASIEDQFKYGIEDGVLVFRGKFTQGTIHKLIKVKRDFEKIREIFSPDIIHAHVGMQAGEIAMFIKKLYNIPYILTEHAPIEMMDFHIRSKIKYNFITQNSDANIAVSPNLRDRLNQIYKNSKFIYINNGVNDPLTIIENDIRKKEKDGVINCSLVGALYSKEIKGLQYLLPAMKMLIQENINIYLHICGGGAYLEYYKQLAEQLGIVENIIFYGMCDKKKLYKIVSDCNFNISASLYESAGIAVEEACLLGKPQVITNSGGANSLIPDQYAIKVGKSSIAELYKGIKKMIYTYKNFDNKEIRKYGVNEFLMDKSCQKYMELYEMVVSKR